MGQLDRALRRLGALSVDVASYRASLGDRALDLSRTQIELLAVMIENQHRVLSRDELSEMLGLKRGRSIDVLLSGLRRVLGDGFLRTVRGRGWIIEPAAFAR